MVKRIFGITLTSIAIALVLAAMVSLYISWSYTNNAVSFAVERVSILPISEEILNILKQDRDYNGCGLSSSQLADIFINSDSYKILFYDYHIENNSEIKINDVRFNHIFTNELKPCVVAYNSGRRNYLLAFMAMRIEDVSQGVLIKSGEKSDEEIFEMVKACKVEMSYFPEGFGNGNGFIDIGKKRNVIGIDPETELLGQTAE